MTTGINEGLFKDLHNFLKDYFQQEQDEEEMERWCSSIDNGYTRGH